MSYTKDFLESKSQQYPEIMKMTDEEALRYLDFMGELVAVSYTHLTLPTTPYV